MHRVVHVCIKSAVFLWKVVGAVCVCGVAVSVPILRALLAAQVLASLRQWLRLLLSATRLSLSSAVNHLVSVSCVC